MAKLLVHIHSHPELKNNVTMGPYTHKDTK